MRGIRRAFWTLSDYGGDRLVSEPVRNRGLVALLKTMKPLEEGAGGEHALTCYMLDTNSFQTRSETRRAEPRSESPRLARTTCAPASSWGERLRAAASHV